MKKLLWPKWFNTGLTRITIVIYYHEYCDKQIINDCEHIRQIFNGIDLLCSINVTGSGVQFGRWVT